MSRSGEAQSVTELRLDNAEEDIKSLLLQIKEHMEDEDERWDEINTRLMKVEKFVDKFTGFIGGVTIVFAGLWAVVTFLVPYLSKLYHNG